MRKKKQVTEPIKKKTGWLLSLEDRLVLSKRRPRDEVLCPECGNKAERSPANGLWRCLASQDIKTNMGSTISILSCGARGHTINGDLITTEAAFKSGD